MLYYKLYNKSYSAFDGCIDRKTTIPTIPLSASAMRRSQSAVEATAEGQLICHIKTQARQTEIVLFAESQKVNDKVKSDSCTAGITKA